MESEPKGNLKISSNCDNANSPKPLTCRRKPREDVKCHAVSIRPELYEIAGMEKLLATSTEIELTSA
jgi:hypothetical protein